MVALHKRLRRRIEVVTKFQELAKAIRFITGGELAKIRKDINRRFVALTSFVPLFSNEYLEMPMSINSPVKSNVSEYSSEESQKLLIIPLCDDRASCGSHNSNVWYRTKSLVNRLQLQNNFIRFYSLGVQSSNFCNKFYGRQILGSSTGLGDIKFNVDLCFFYAEKFISYKFDKYYLVFNRFFNMQQQFPNVYCLCSYNDFLSALFKNSFTNRSLYYDAILDQSNYNSFLEDLYLFGFSMFILDAFNENKYSFLGARFAAMDQMINNTQEILEILVIKYNKLRQESITTELLEIIGCKDVVLEQK